MQETASNLSPWNVSGHSNPAQMCINSLNSVLGDLTTKKTKRGPTEGCWDPWSGNIFYLIRLSVTLFLFPHVLLFLSLPLSL